MISSNLYAGLLGTKKIVKIIIPSGQVKLTVVFVKNAPVVKHSKVDIFHSVAVVITNRCSTSRLFRSAVLSHNPLFLRRVLIRYYYVKHTVRTHSTTGAMNMVKASLLRGKKFQKINKRSERKQMLKTHLAWALTKRCRRHRKLAFW